MRLYKEFTTKQIIIIASATIGLGLVLSAIYFKRKRQKRFPDSSGSKTAKEHTDQFHLDESSSTVQSPSSIKVNKHHHSRNGSYATSIASSATSSATSRTFRKLYVNKSQDLTTVEKLYKEGVSSFEEAIEKWEKATDLLEIPITAELSSSSASEQTLTGSNSDCSQLSKATARRNYLNKYFSVSDLSRVELDKNQDSPFKSDKQKKLTRLHSNSMGDLSEMFKEMKVEKGSSATSLQEQLLSIVNKAKRLQQAIDYVMYDEGTDSDTDITLTGLDYRNDDEILTDDDTESTASYFSAKEFWDTRSMDSISKRLIIYEEALAVVEKGEVHCRTNRASLLNCFSEDEFLAKLHCVRQGLEIMLQDITVRNWLKENGRSMIECMLCIAGQGVAEFQESFDNLFTFVNCAGNWRDIETELKGRKVVQMSFYDIVLDFVLMDAFDDLDNPPGPVISIMQNRWLANSFKESALYAAIWSVLKAKRSRLQNTNGFIARLYDVSTHVTPILAWGFLGPDGNLKDTCIYFKKEIIDFLQGLFSFDQVRYTTPTQMADDILKLSKTRFDSLTNYLQNSIANTSH